jgi:hypothetical protein
LKTKKEFDIFDYLYFSYIRHLKTFPKYINMTEDEILREVESDPHTLRQRTKEILKGKLSDSYAVYIAKYPIKYVIRFLFFFLIKNF